MVTYEKPVLLLWHERTSRPMNLVITIILGVSVNIVTSHFFPPWLWTDKLSMEELSIPREIKSLMFLAV